MAESKEDTMPYVAGIDIGSGSTKTVVIDGERRIIGMGLARSQADFDAVARESLSQACHAARIDQSEIAYIAATGMGRYSLEQRDIQITDLTCGARGAHAVFPEAEYVLDMGAQCTRAISLRDGGKVKSFRTNEKCAAGSGGFLERIARYLEITLADIGRLSLEADDPQPISSVCAVLAESEIINHVSEGKTIANILRGAHDSLAGRTLSQLKLVGYGRDAKKDNGSTGAAVVFIGGVALQEGMIAACEERLEQALLIPEHPAHVAAFGAAILGLQRLNKRVDAAAPGQPAKHARAAIASSAEA
jgi:(R)-2-hydroxyacyl-CoA dehydratese activating ATPase